jgi:hypothetical protein
MSFTKSLVKPAGGRPSTHFHLSLDMAKELGMVERNPKGKQIRDYFIKCEERLLEMLSHPVQSVPAQPAPAWPKEVLAQGIENLSLDIDRHDRWLDSLATRQGLLEQDVGDIVVLAATLKADLAMALGQSRPGAETASAPASAREYSGADAVFMACLALVGGEQPAVLPNGEAGASLVANTSPASAFLRRSAQALAWLLRNVPPHTAALRYKQGELAKRIGLSSWNLKVALVDLATREFLSVARVGKPYLPGPGFELRVHWDNIEAAARRDGVDLAALGVVQPASLAQKG